jgi:UDP-glucose 4-epimerase
MTERFPILVTGGAGYIGSHAVLALLDADWPVVVLDNLSTGFRWAVPESATFVEGDVGDQAQVESVIRKHGVRAIIHFAGSIIVPESVENPLKYYRNNTANSLSLIASAVETGVAHFIFSSTAATYGVPEEVPIPEGAANQPINPYGTSKLMTEFMLRDVAAAHPINYCALRYFNVAGADPAGRSGQSTAGATHLIKVACEVVTGKRAHVGVFGTDFPTSDGTGVRDYIHVSDLADAHVKALEALIAQPATSHVVNCGYGHGYSVLEVLDAVDRVTNVKVTRVIEGRRAGDPPALVSQNRAIRERFGWVPARDNLDGIIKDALAWERILAERSVMV